MPHRPVRVSQLSVAPAVARTPSGSCFTGQQFPGVVCRVSVYGFSRNCALVHAVINGARHKSPQGRTAERRGSGISLGAPRAPSRASKCRDLLSIDRREIGQYCIWKTHTTLTTWKLGEDGGGDGDPTAPWREAYTLVQGWRIKAMDNINDALRGMDGGVIQGGGEMR